MTPDNDDDDTVEFDYGDGVPDRNWSPRPSVCRRNGCLEDAVDGDWCQHHLDQIVNVRMALTVRDTAGRFQTSRRYRNYPRKLPLP